MRRVISFLLAIALTLCGAVLVVLQLVTAYETGAFRGIMAVAAGMMLVIGIYWIYEDFLRRPAERDTER
jgi:ABC-type nickel/cobalt efflux system permease component RcnA